MLQRRAIGQAQAGGARKYFCVSTDKAANPVNMMEFIRRVPAGAVVERDGGKAAFVVRDDDTVELRTLKLGGKLGGDVQVLEGLAPGETVVVDPPDALEQGARVSSP